MREHSGIAGAIAGAAFVFLVILPALIAIAIITFLVIYAIVKAFGVGGDHASAGTVIVGVALLVTVFATAIATGLGLLGRAMSPRKKRRTENKPSSP